MLAKILSSATVGLDGTLIKVEVDVGTRSLPSFTIVGLPGKAVEESKERVRAALQNIGAKFPKHRIIVNLSPADLPKEGPTYDLPIAVGILRASRQLKAKLNDSLFLGELSLDGSLRSTKASLSTALLARKKKIKNLFVPKVNTKEAAVVGGVAVYPVQSLTELWHHLQGVKKIKRQKLIKFSDFKTAKVFDFDLAEIVGQEGAKRALTIAAAGNHNIFMSGPPGAGKTLLSRTLPSILPKMTKAEALETSKIYSIVGEIPIEQGLITTRPFRSPHHTVSRIGLIGGGTKPRPGEISLAHRGILFLDEFPEFPRTVLEALRQPIEDGIVQISRAAGTMRFPAKFLLVAAANPCPCGFYGSSKKNCHCSASQIDRYQKRISGPIIDRIDININVPEVKVEKLIRHTQKKNRHGQSSYFIRKKVEQARQMQLARFKKKNIPIYSNGEMNHKQVKNICELDVDTLKILHQALSRMSLSARSYFKIIKIARTIADLAGEEKISTHDIAEALQYRKQEEHEQVL